MWGRQSNRRGLSLVEIICATGFLTIFTTALLAVATKGLMLGRQQVDVAAAYAYAELTMEVYANQARDPDGWATMSPITSPVFPKRSDSDQNSQAVDTRFVYTVSVDNLDNDLRLVTVTIYFADEKKAAAGQASVDITAPRGGELIRFINVYQQEVNNA